MRALRNGVGRIKKVWGGSVSGWVLAAVAGVAAAVSAGTVPDVIKGWWGDQRWFLTVLCVGAAAMFAVINLWQQRSKGVGIVVALPRERWRKPWSGQWIDAAIDHARKHHDSCFAVRRTIPSEADPEMERRARKDALELAYELVTARLTEISEADSSTPVSLYVNAALPDAFELGSMFKFNVQRELRSIAARQGVDVGGPVLTQRSERAYFDFFPAVRISGRLKDPLSPAEKARAEKLATVVEKPDFEGDADGGAVALVVHLADNPRMVAQALRAARDGCEDVDGRVERCRAALVIDAGPANIPENGADFELVIRYVYSAWREWTRARPQLANLQMRLFIAAPASVTFALGWLFGHEVKVVPHPYQVGERNKTGETCTSS
ncbi:hypothetical protein SAMN04489764_4320 [Thermostaphylospora chromogena]|uniref:SMODS-associated and fused to various effectors domain-containing protein n=1 Tax=Thermostaphylospora chromogena TaxID=35622 RepID=A0A1H1HDY0_9ACTN|nr:hypothetical protein SAMN04489764_4320 [Thermostaphylospora chromogena]